MRITKRREPRMTRISADKYGRGQLPHPRLSASSAVKFVFFCCEFGSVANALTHPGDQFYSNRCPVPGSPSRARRAASTRARAASAVAASAVKCPILRPGRACNFPYKCNLTSSRAQASGPIRVAHVPQITQEIRHGRRPQQLGRYQRQITKRTQLLLELASDTGVDRQVPRVVGPWEPTR